MPVARVTSKKSKIADRVVDSRLKGADLYVARLAWKRPQTDKLGARSKKELSTDVSSATSLHSSLSDLSITDSRPSPTGSLYDELSCSSRIAPSQDPVLTIQSSENDCATSSRPCYRCISYMQLAGIRRVFWTNNEGEWEGEKVRDLVDALGLGNETEIGSTAGLFVTKHEVLMLRRQMGE